MHTNSFEGENLIKIGAKKRHRFFFANANGVLINVKISLKTWFAELIGLNIFLKDLLKNKNKELYFFAFDFISKILDAIKVRKKI